MFFATKKCNKRPTVQKCEYFIKLLSLNNIVSTF
jgi:hypothetical protein